MKQSIGYTVTLNIIIVFIIVIFAFLGFALIYFKANKVTNTITGVVEKYEGYNKSAENEVIARLSSIGYNMKKVNCENEIDTKATNKVNERIQCKLATQENGLANGTDYANGQKGYCIYLCDEGDYYYYKIRTNMFLDMPIVSAIDIPIYTNTNRLYDFEDNL